MRAGGDLPAVGGELAGDRDRDDPAGFAAGVFELAPAGVQPALRAPGDVDDLGCLPALAALERLTDDGAAAVVVGGLDQQPAGVGGAGLGDRPEPALSAGGVLAGNDPEVGGELVGMIEAPPLADLRAQPERGQRVDPAQASQPRDRVRARRAERELREVGLDLVAAGDQHVVGVQVVGQRRPRGMIGEPDRGQPRAVLARPRLTRSLPVDLAAQQELPDPVPGAHQIARGCPRGSGPDRAAAHARPTGS